MPEEPAIMTPPDTGAAAAGADTGGAAPPEVEEVVVETPTEGGAPAEGQTPAEPVEEEPVDYGGDDGRKMDGKTRQAIGELAKTNREAAKALRELYFPAQEVAKELGVQNMREAVHAVRGMKATIDSLGGEEGITNMQEELTDWRGEADQFAKGDPALLAELNESNPEAFDTAIMNGIDLIIEKGGIGRFDKAFARAMHLRLEHAGFYKAVGDLIKYVEEGNGQGAYTLLTDQEKGIKQWLDSLKLMAGDRKPATPRDTRQDELDARQKKLDDREYEQFVGNVEANVDRNIAPGITRATAPLFRDLKLSTEGQRDFLNTLKARIWKALGADKSYLRQVKSIREQGNPKRTAEFIAGKFDELLPDHYRALRNARYPSYKPNARPVTNASKTAPNGAAKVSSNAGNSGGVRLVDKKPAPPEIDYGKTTDEMLNFGGKFGEAVTKAGSRVRWEWARQ